MSEMGNLIKRPSISGALLFGLSCLIVTISACSPNLATDQVESLSSFEPTATLVLPTPHENQGGQTPIAPLIIPTVTTQPTITPTEPSSDYLLIDHLFTGAEIKGKIDFSETKVNIGNYDVVYRSEEGFLELKDATSWHTVKDQFPVQINENEGIYLRFKFSRSSSARVYLMSITNNDIELRWGFLPDYFPRTYVKEGDVKFFESWIRGDLVFQPDQWYDAVFVVGKQGSFSTIIWDPINPEVQHKYQRDLPEEWENQPWELEVRVFTGSFCIQELLEFSFDEIK
jgi:hypothetical protein